MRCREFRNKHVAYVDDVLSAVDTDAMRWHAAHCLQCARQDMLVRRSLLLVRNLPQIEPSPEFFARLNARLAQAPMVEQPRRRPATTATLMTALAASVLIAGYVVLRGSAS